jgi:PAS domain-containing protein
MMSMLVRVFCSILLFCGLSAQGANPSKIEAKQGTLNLADWNMDKASRFPLHGEWIYFWDRLDDEDTLKQGLWLFESEGSLIKSGTAWKDLQPSKSESGSITYALRITGLEANGKNLGLVFGQFMNAHRAYSFDPLTRELRLLSEVGRVSRDPEEALPQMRKVLAPLPQPAGDEIWLILQASSYLVPGAFHFVPELGRWDLLQKQEKQTDHEAFWILGMFSLLFVSNLSLFILRRDDHASLMMSLFSLVMGLRYASTEAVLSVFFPEPNIFLYALASCFIPSALPLGLCLYLHFFSATFPGHYPRWALRSAYALAFLHFALTLITLFQKNWPHLDTEIMALLLILAGILVHRLLRLTRRGENGASLSLIGFVILLVTMCNDVFVFMNYYSFPYVGHYGMLAFIFTQSLVVAGNFAIAFRTARHLTHSLQKEVERQTRDVKSILKNIHQGIFTVRPGFAMGDDYSPFLEDILGTQDLAGKSAMELIFARSQLTQEQKSMLETILETSLNEALLNFEVNADHLVREMAFKDHQGREKDLLVDWDPITDSSGCIEKILVTLRDVTEMKAMEQKNRQHQRDMELIAEIIEVAADRFQQFLASSRRFLEENFRILERRKFLVDQDLKILFINYHTMKGAARTYRFLGMTNIIHEAEQFIASVQKGQANWDQAQAQQDLKRVREVFAEYERVNRDKLKREDNHEFVKLELETVRENIKALDSLGSIRLDERLTPFVDRIRRTFFQLYFQELRLIFNSSERHLEQLARDLHKEKPQLILDCVPVGVTKEAADLLQDILIHIYRNIMDHGIETAEERLQKGKAAQGTLRVTANVDEQQKLRIRFCDDGRGIQLEKIAAIARRRKLLAEEQPDPEKVANLIFQPGFSTADSVTDISGRGVGMTAVVEYLEKAGGHVQIILLEESSSLRAVSFALDVYLPTAHYSRLPEDESEAA